MRRNDPRSIDPLVDQHRPIDKCLLFKRRLVAGVKICNGATRPVALRAIRVQIRSRPILHAAHQIVSGRERRNIRKVGIVQYRREQPKMIPRAQLVLRHPRGVGERAVHLARLYAEYAAGIRVMANETILAARVVPRLADFSRRRLDGDLFGPARGEQIRVAVIRPPFVNGAVHATRAVAHQQACFEPVFGAGIGRVGRQLEGLDEHRASRKGPFSGRRKSYLAVREGNPSRLRGAIGPKSHHEVVRNQPLSGNEAARVAEGTRLRQLRRNLAAGQMRHAQVGGRCNPRRRAMQR